MQRLLPQPPFSASRELNRLARELLEKQFAARCGSRARSPTSSATTPGHCYFTLKDAEAAGRLRDVPQPRAAARLAAARTACRSRCARCATLYEARGKFQLNVEVMRRGGPGRALRGVRAAEGEARARGPVRCRRASAPLPRFPRAIGIVTSPQAAALRDVLTDAAAPHAGLPVILYPAPVQGEGAGARIARGDRAAPTRARGATC